MSLGTYGMNGAAPRQRSFGNGLVGMGEQEEQQGFGLMRQAAMNETSLNVAKSRHEAEKKAGRAQLGSTVGGLAGGAIAGATWGTSMGPWGSLVGGILGGLMAAGSN